MRHLTILPTQRGVLLQAGVPVRWLESGRHFVWSGTLTRYDLTEGATLWSPELEAILPHGAADRIDVPANHRGLLTVDGLPTSVLAPGRWLVWKIRSTTDVQIVDTDDITTPIPSAFVALIPSGERHQAVICDENRGLLKQGGRLVALLSPGEHWLWWMGQGNSVTLITTLWTLWTPQLDAILPPNAAEILDVPVGQIATISQDGIPATTLVPGRYILWQLSHRITAELHATDGVHTTLPHRWWPLVTPGQLQTTTVKTHQRALLYIDGALSEVLEPGRYGVNTLDRDVRLETVDLWEQELQITGQEVMTADKVSLRINIIVRFQITDPVLACEGTSSVTEALYSEAQMVARRHVAGVTVDHLLEKRNAARVAMLSELADRGEVLGVAIAGVDLKDVILPGEMKAIFNQVIAAQKRAAANVITRREETAATRSLANTARMLENNPTLLKLKELEALKELAERVGTVNIVATPGELMGRLSLSST
ncbi:MAG: regulator of protease activity HflC (stomatin/prohibitin superfamily) [Myxococcota bacterium]|jgi:regulator of protease activity HflC (stomatin/prohibitin superfamily)